MRFLVKDMSQSEMEQKGGVGKVNWMVGLENWSAKNMAEVVKVGKMVMVVKVVKVVNKVEMVKVLGVVNTEKRERGRGKMAETLEAAKRTTAVCVDRATSCTDMDSPVAKAAAILDRNLRKMQLWYPVKELADSFTLTHL